MTDTFLLLAALVFLAVIIVRADQLTVDRDAYLGIAQSLVDGRGFSTPGTTTPTAFRPPLYPMLLAALMTVLTPAWSVAVVNLVAGLIVVGCGLRLGKALDLGRARSVAALLIIFNPLLLNALPQPMTEVVFTALTTAWWCSLITPGDSPWKAIRTGTLFGLAALCRPTIWPLAILMGLVWIVRLRPLAPAAGERARVGGRTLPATRHVFLIMVATALTVSPWIIRNQFVFGRPLLMTTHGGYTFN